MEDRHCSDTTHLTCGAQRLRCRDGGNGAGRGSPTNSDVAQFCSLKAALRVSKVSLSC
jgi:hypothetical protein